MCHLSKATIRKEMRALGNSIEADFRERAAHEAAKIFAAHTLFQNSQRIACYLAREDEFDSLPCVQAIWQAHKHCYLPALSPGDEKHLNFIAYNEGDALRENQFRILEPKNVFEPIAPESLDIILAPLLAFDKTGHRLGTGAGYYDRTLNFKRDRKQQKPLFIGLAYQLQEVESIPADPWDILLDGVITETGWKFF